MSLLSPHKSSKRLKLIYSFRPSVIASNIQLPEISHHLQPRLQHSTGNSTAHRPASPHDSLAAGNSINGSSTLVAGLSAIIKEMNMTSPGMTDVSTNHAVDDISWQSAMETSEICSNIINETDETMDIQQEMSNYTSNEADVILCHCEDQCCTTKSEGRKRYSADLLYKLKNSPLSLEVHPVLLLKDSTTDPKHSFMKHSVKVDLKKLIPHKNQKGLLKKQMKDNRKMLINEASRERKHMYDATEELIISSNAKRQKNYEDLKWTAFSQKNKSLSQPVCNRKSDVVNRCGETLKTMSTQVPVKLATSTKNEKIDEFATIVDNATEGNIKSPATEDIEIHLEQLLKRLNDDYSNSIIIEVQSLPIHDIEDMKQVINILFEKTKREPTSSLACARMMKALTSVPCATDLVYGNYGHQLRLLVVERCDSQLAVNACEEMRRDTLLAEICLEKDVIRKRELYKKCLTDDKRLKNEFVAFIGLAIQLFKLQLLSARMIRRCIHQLLSSDDDASLECLCELFISIGRDLELTHRSDLSEYFTRLEVIAHLHSERAVSIPLRALILHVVELRKGKWEALTL